MVAQFINNTLTVKNQKGLPPLFPRWVGSLPPFGEIKIIPTSPIPDIFFNSPYQKKRIVR
ncbi:MAG: hypothetical protein DRR00_12875 [Candidatus Parabeggiatoa sp. nov. 3]|nr:MAG: hypothetical protein DRR00_12875 [Gammaproteobacteria bacterium]RKZ66578.1 MAG: hypothetical protein DRQ99_09240 [Gammaproteobacteria bacterium]